MRLIALVLATAAALAACDQHRIEKLEEGLSTETDVRRQFGEPSHVSERADGSKVLEYPRQPEGSTNYLIVIGTDGKMSSLRQLLTPANFTRVQTGMAQVDVRRALGKPAKTQSFAGKPDEEVWDWRFLDGQQKKVFTVTFDRERRVLSSATMDDPRETLAGGR
ncbi:outer membrane protein assembly factor BamE [Ideonella sp. A 288]|uniref:outer membrane protein assembly factor BamE n=1 Tax=Ideonella sp. A 288 TaxID=1962181 RepID=UPI000B4A6CBE|nr:outer membrane protein assembly factor BamE [Ideonella sp. A 288]